MGAAHDECWPWVDFDLRLGRAGPTGPAQARLGKQQRSHQGQRRTASRLIDVAPWRLASASHAARYGAT